MDITSYLLGKKASGGGSGLDWTVLGYDSPPTTINDGYNYALEIKNNWVPDTYIKNKFYKDKNIVFMPFVDTSISTNVNGMLRDCVCLVKVAQLDFSNATNVASLFSGDAALRDVPVFNFKKATLMDYLFSGCITLTNSSVDNILQSCISATSYTGTKTLAQLGFTSANYPATTIQALPHYQGFIDAGWTIGY